jgi:predicted ATP-grasp superfamily ATP-dependent carboligase
LAGASRYCEQAVVVSDPLIERHEFMADLERVARDLGADVLIPVTDPSLLAVLPEPKRFAARIPFPAADAFTAISSKSVVADRASEVDIEHPRQAIVYSAGEALERVDRELYPVVVKPHRSVVGTGRDRVKVSVAYAHTPTELLETLRGLAPAVFPVLVQQRILGPGVGIFLLLWDGEVRATFAHRRIREKPPSGGVSVYRESIVPPPDLVERSTALLRAFDWRGVAMVEYKVDERTGTPYLMEVNGRFWGSLQLAIDAGVDFPRLLLEAAEGIGGAGPPRYRIGVRTRWLLGDLDHLWGRLKPGGDQDLPPGAPSRLRTALQVAIPWKPGDRTEVFRPSDPLPFLRESLQWWTGR